MMSLKNTVLFLGIIVSLQQNLALSDVIPYPEPGNHNLFAADLFHALVESRSSENILFSPLSAETALTMLFAGAEGKTAEDMRKVLRLDPVDKARITQDFGQFLKTLIQSNAHIKDGDPELFLANRIYVADRLKISAEFNRIAEENFDAVAESVNFAEAKLTSDKINTWVEQQTHNKIKSLLSEKDINSLTNIVLVNGLYFKGQWKQRFNKEDTKSVDFHLNSKEKIQVDMMHTRGSFNYAHLADLDATALELPYNNSDLSLLLVLPNEIEGLEKLQVKLKTLEFNYIPSRLTPVKNLCINIPKFRIEQELDLIPVLKKLGLSNIFSDEADFSGIFDSPTSTFISVVKQKAIFEIDEIGSEAAASSGIGGECRSVPSSFNADHPFMFGIRSKSAVYFAGHVANF